MEITFLTRSILICGLVSSIVACNDHKTSELPGYVEGKYSYISSSTNGTLKELYVTPGQEVTINQALFSLNLPPENDTLLAMQARLDQAKSDQKKVEYEYLLQKSIFDRKNGLYQKNIISKEEFDLTNTKYQQAYSQLLSANANVSAIAANVQKSAWAVTQKNITAPFSGLVFDTYYNVGEFVQTNSPVVSLLSTSKIKVIFYCHEPLLGNIRLNQQIEVSCDDCKNSIKAKITFISPKAEYTPPVIYSSDVRGKLSYRVEALPLMSNAITTLHPGQPVTVKINF